MLFRSISNVLGKGVAGYSAIAILAQAVQMICGLAVLRWLTPAQMGIWLALQAAEAYALWIRLGVVNALNREYPYLRGRGEYEKAVLHVQTAGTYMAGCASLLALGFVGSAMLLADKGSDWQLALICFAAHSAGGLWRSFIDVTFRGGQEFARLVRLQITGAILQAVSLPLVAYGGFRGYCLRAVVLAVVLTALWHVLRPVKAALRWDRAILGKLLREGLPLFGANYLNGVAAQFPRLVLIVAGGTAMLGLYAPVSAVLAAGALLPSTLLLFLLPKQNFDFGGNVDASRLASEGWQRACFLSVLLLPVGLVGWWAARMLVQYWMPEYNDALPALGYAVGIVVLSPLRLVTSIFSTLKAWWPMMVHVVTGLLLTGMLPWLFWKLAYGEPLVAVVRGVLVAQLLHALAAWPCVRWAIRSAVPGQALPCISLSGPVR